MSFSFRPYLGHFANGYLGSTSHMPAHVGSFSALWPQNFVCDPELKSEQAVYDLASLTKVICTSTLLASFYLESGENWQQFIVRDIIKLLPELKGTPFEGVTLAMLWEHRSGLRPWRSCFFPARSPLFQDTPRALLWRQVLSVILKEKPSLPISTLYSDLGFLLLGLYLERSFDVDLETLWIRWKIAHSISPFHLSFGTQERSYKNGEVLVPTEQRHAQGEVNDDNAYSLGGVAPHSGLFGTVQEVWAWLEAILSWCQRESRLNLWITNSHKGRFHAGWDTPGDPATTQAGAHAPEGVLGHLGFSGTAFWWDPDTKKAGILLSNRVYPSHSLESQNEIRYLRRDFFSKVWEQANDSIK